MELEFNRQFLALQNELSNFKNSLSPLFQFIQDVQDIRKRHHISQANNVSNFSLLVMDIKDEIMRDVAHMNKLTDDKLGDLKHELSNSIYDSTLEIGAVKDEVYKVYETLKEMNSEIFASKHIGGENTMYIKEIRKELEKKASLNQIDEMRTVVRTMTPLTSFESLKSRVNDCVTIYQFQELEKSVEKIKKKMLAFMTVDQVEEKLKQFTITLSNEFQLSYITSKSFDAHRHNYEKMFNEVNDGILSAKEYANKLDKGTKDKLNVLKKALESRPWKSEIGMLQDILSKMMPKDELLAFINDTKSQVSTFSQNMIRFKVSVERFEKVVERFDEILLDKAEKDQITKINKQLESCASMETVESIKKMMLNFTKDNETRFLGQCALVDKIKSSFDYLVERFETLKRENFDVSNFANTVADFKETVERKADKQDIFEIYDNMCKRIEYIEVNESLKLLKRQVEQGTALVFALCRTLVKNGEPPAHIKKQRYELLKNFNSLMNWMSGEIISPGVNISMQKVFESMEEDERVSSRQSSLLRRRSVMTAKENKRVHIDFPKLG